MEQKRCVPLPGLDFRSLHGHTCMLSLHRELECGAWLWPGKEDSALRQLSSKCSALTRNVSITWKPVKNSDSAGRLEICVSASLQVIWCRLKCENLGARREEGMGGAPGSRAERPGRIQTSCSSLSYSSLTCHPKWYKCLWRQTELFVSIFYNKYRKERTQEWAVTFPPSPKQSHLWWPAEPSRPAGYTTLPCWALGS